MKGPIGFYANELPVSELAFRPTSLLDTGDPVLEVLKPWLSVLPAIKKVGTMLCIERACALPGRVKDYH